MTFQGLKKVAVALLMAAALSMASMAEAAPSEVSVFGLPEWMQPLAQRSLEAVWAQIPSDHSRAGRARLITLVAGRLFEGYAVTSIDVDGDDLIVTFAPLEAGAWKVEVIPPELPSPLDEWFAGDLTGVREALSELLGTLPPAALSWCGKALEEEVRRSVENRIPGWATSLLFRSEGVSWSLELRFIPRGTLLLAFDPRLSSTTLPVMLLRTDLKEDVLERLEPLMGLPVAWLDHHRLRVEAWAGERLRERSVVARTKANVDVAFRAERISAVDVSVESHRYVLWAWAAAYAGTKDRYPEVGIHLGRRAKLFRWWEGELYYEGVLEMEDFDLESRWGFRWSPWGDVWLGVETVHPGALLWGRLSLGGRVGRPYLWWRFSEESDHNLGLGYRLNEYISLELHYDDDDEDSLSFRAIGNL